MKFFITFGMVFGIALGNANPTEDEFLEKISKNNPYKKSEFFSPELMPYVSIDLVAIANLCGMINVGCKHEGEKHGYDFGLGICKTWNFYRNFLYASYLRFFDSTDKARYYAGIGARGGVTWGRENNLYQFSGLFSTGRTFITKDRSRKFLEINFYWPTFYRYQLSIPYELKESGDVLYKRNFYSHGIAVGALYGWYF